MEQLGLAGLLVSSFTSATLLPGTSELVLATMIVAGGWPLALLLVVATIGNVAGSTVNWGIGRAAHRLQGSRFWPASDAQQERAENWYARYGRWSLLASWVPVIGDPLTLVAGVMREPLLRFLLIVTVAKFLRYAIIAAAAHQIVT